MARSALESMERAFTENYIPMGVEHDPRIPPIGRFTDAWIEDLPDGSSILKGIGEIFEPGDVGSEQDKKTIRERPPSADGLEIIFDRTYENEEDIQDIKAIAEILGTQPRYEGKKAVEPLSVLALAAAFALGGVASGFFGAIGTDAYNWMKEKLSTLIQRQKSRSKEQLLLFSFSVIHSGVTVLVQVILENPTESEISEFFAKTIYELDSIPLFLFDPKARVSRVVYFAKSGKLQFEYAVRKDGYPMTYTIET